jgi:universal stress protein A
MDDYTHLLLAADLSPDADKVAERARQVRDRSGARLSLVHVVEYIPLAYAGDLVLPDDFNLEQELLEVARRRIEALGERLGVDPQDRHVATGSAAREILRIAREQGVDLIVLGSHGRHGLAALIGSTANAVLHHAECDLLAVRVAAPRG